MNKTENELNEIKEEIETLNQKLSELSEEELKEVTGGLLPIPYVSTVRNIIKTRVKSNFVSDSWKSDILPSEPGKYRIETDVELDKKWIPDAEKTTIENNDHIDFVN